MKTLAMLLLCRSTLRTPLSILRLVGSSMSPLTLSSIFYHVTNRFLGAYSSFVIEVLPNFFSDGGDGFFQLFLVSFQCLNKLRSEEPNGNSGLVITYFFCQIVTKLLDPRDGGVKESFLSLIVCRIQNQAVFQNLEEIKVGEFIASLLNP